MTRTRLLFVALISAAAGCNDQSSSSVSYASREPYQVGIATYDSELPPEPRLPTEAELCATLEASNSLVSRPDGALPPEADPSPPGARVAADPAIVNPDQARIQAALDACGASVNVEVGGAILAVDAAATAEQIAAGQPNVNISGASGEELAKPMYRASKYAVRLKVNSNGPGDAFITGPLTMPSGVTLWIDSGVTVYATRDVMAYSPNAAGPYCANTAVSPSRGGSSGNCTALFTGTNTVNTAIVGDGVVDGRAYAEIVTSNRFYPLMKVDLTCSNTYTAYAMGAFAADGTPCDDGGTFVNSRASARNMTWWDLAWLGNVVENGRTGVGAQSNFRTIVYNYAKNFTLYRITLSNSANFHVVPAGVDGFTVWGVKVLTPSLAAYANPAGNQNPLYTGALFAEDNVKNTDAFDPASSSRPISGRLTIGSRTTTTGTMSFDGYLKNVVFAFNWISTGDDDFAVKGSNNPAPAGSGLPGVDGDRDVRSDRKYGLVVAHNHFYWGHGISIGSETNSGVRNMHVYDNSFDGSEEALRIKSDYARGGEVSNIWYDRTCIRHALNSLLFTPYYSTRPLPAGGPLIPNFHDIHLSNTWIDPGSDGTTVRLQGFEENTGGFQNPQYPLVMSLENVVATDPNKVNLIASDTQLTLRGVNLYLFPSVGPRTGVNGTPTQAVDPAKVLDCRHAFVPFPSNLSPRGATWNGP
jgi:polygalacturonase